MSKIINQLFTVNFGFFFFFFFFLAQKIRCIGLFKQIERPAAPPEACLQSESMFTNQSTDIVLDAPCRSLDAVHAEKVDNLWVAGTANPSLQILRFHPDLNGIEIERTFDLSDHYSNDHHAAIRSVACSPSSTASANDNNSWLVITAPEQGNGGAATLWKIPEKSKDPVVGDHNPESLEHVAELLPEGGFGANLVDIDWRKSEDGSGQFECHDVLTLDTNGHLTYFDAATTQCVRSVDTTPPSANSHASTFFPPPRAVWDPHSNGDAVAASNGRCVSIFDWRTDTSIPTGTVEHFYAKASIHDLDYNPNKPYILATATQDARMQFWDLRNAKRPLLTARGGHSHWCCTVQYNPFHDQLVLSTGTDGIANLWRLSTISSAPLLHEPDQRVARLEANDSIYAAAWGAADAWIYMTVSYDGKAVLSHVPSREKYKILL
jgi:WD40 repeat protein